MALEGKQREIYQKSVKADRSDHHISQASLAHLFNLQDFAQVRKQTLPRKLILNTINVCNADCVFCAYQYRVDPNATMPLELVDKVTKEYAAFHPSPFVTLTPTVGDPLIDADIFKKVAIAKNNGIKRVQFYTNGILLLKRLDELLASPLDNLEISLADFDATIYQQVFRSKSYSQVLQGISTLLQKLQESDHPLVVQINLRGPRPLTEVTRSPDYLQHVVPYLTDKIFISDTPVFDNWMGLIQSADLPAGMELLADNKQLFHLPCRRLFDLQVLADGKVRMCGCRSKETVYDDLVVGDVMKQSLLEIWDSPEVINIMNSFFHNNYPAACRGCNYYGPVNSKPTRTFATRKAP